VHHRDSVRFPGELGKSGCDPLRIVPNPASPEQRRQLRDHAGQIRFSRGLRGKLFDQNIFGEPAWEIILTLYTIDSDRRRLNTRELSVLAGVALTTVLRWLDYLEEQGFIVRSSNPYDHRMVYIELAQKGRTAMDEYLLQMHSAKMFGPIASGKE
jgi:DNA-binding MarR family transcriptional regulator